MSNSNAKSNRNHVSFRRQLSVFARTRILGLDLLAKTIADPQTLKSAWRAVRKSGGGPGVDGRSIDDLRQNSEQTLLRIQRQILAGYGFHRLRRVATPKPDGGQRVLGIPTVADRIVLQALRFRLEPHFEPLMSNSSHAYRPRRSAHSALRQVQHALAAKQTYVIETDVRKFFDSIDHSILLSQLKAIVPEYSNSNLLKSALAVSDGTWLWRTLNPRSRGVAQGSPLSPLLANLFLRPFDRTVGQVNSSTLVRYADDLIVLCRSQALATDLLVKIKRELRKLKLEIHPAKTRITNASNSTFEFLGFEVGQQTIHPSRENVRKFQKSVAGLTNPRKHLSPRFRIERLSAVCRSFSWYFHVADCGKLMLELDERIRTNLAHLKGGRSIARKVPRLKKLYDSYRGGNTMKRRGARYWNGYG